MLAGCMNKSIERGKEITPEEQSVIVDGQTTKSEIFMNFGELSKTMNNEKVFFFRGRGVGRDISSVLARDRLKAKVWSLFSTTMFASKATG